MGIWPKFNIFHIVYIKYLIMNSVFGDWSYKNTSKWDETWKECAGLHQSPLDIIDSQAATFTKPITISFENFVIPVEANLTNNGKTAKLELSSSANVSVIGNRLYINNHYKLKQVHFHWSDSIAGSEHKINGKSASMEVHLVNYNLKYKQFETAKEKNDGILVLSVLVDVSTNVSQNSFWSKFSDKLAMVHNPGSKTKLQSVTFSNFLPRNRDDFYLYKGSFTTPPCSEKVTWVVYREKLLIPEEYLQRFWALRTNTSSGSQVLVSNIRPVKPLNSRIVLKTFESSGGNDLKTYIYERVFRGLDVLVQVRFYQCRVPTSVRLSIAIPSLNIAWESQNLTSDIQRVPLDAQQPYGVSLEIHHHPLGRYKDNMHVTVKLDSDEIIGEYYNLSKDCWQDSCFWSSVGKSRTCSRRLIDTDEKLLFTLTRQNSCDDVYDVTIKKDNRVIFKTSIKNKTRVKVTPRAVDQQLKTTLGRWYLFLNVDKDRMHRAKLFLELPRSSLSIYDLLIDGVYHNDSNCQSGTHHVKLIVGITLGLFILAVIILTVCFLRRNIKKNRKPNVLVEEDELDAAL